MVSRTLIMLGLLAVLAVAGAAGEEPRVGGRRLQRSDWCNIKTKKMRAWRRKERRHGREITRKAAGAKRREIKAAHGAEGLHCGGGRVRSGVEEESEDEDEVEAVEEENEDEDEAVEEESEDEDEDEDTGGDMAAVEGGSKPGDDLMDGLLAMHNSVRSKHGASSLTWSSTLAKHAQDHCDAAFSGGSLRHASNLGSLGEGENLAWSSGGMSVGVAENGWVDNEMGPYCSNPGSFSSSTGHFTQCVWKATTELGCASCMDGSAETLVCRYRPAGNVMGSFDSNVEC